MTQFLDSIWYGQWILHALVLLPLLGVIPVVAEAPAGDDVGAPVVLDEKSKAGKAYRDAVSRYLGAQLEFRYASERSSLFGFGFVNRLWRRSA